jgi:hypothetical protein
MGSQMQQLMDSQLGFLMDTAMAKGMHFMVDMLPGTGQMGNNSRRMCT